MIWLCSYINTIFYVGVHLHVANVQENGKDELLIKLIM